MPSTGPLRLTDLPHFIEDNPGFSFGSLRFEPGDDVLCILGISFTNQGTYEQLYDNLSRMVTVQGGRLWLQAFDMELLGDISENLGIYPNLTPSGALADCLIQMVDRLPLPNGNMPKHLVFAFNGSPENCRSQVPPSSPTWNGQKIPTTLVMPLSTFKENVHAIWEQSSDVDILDPHTLLRFKEALAQAEVAELRRLCNGVMDASLPARSRRRL